MNNLIAESIEKQFGSKMLLNDIALSCKTGEIVGLLGRNGTGKSTLLKIIFGSESATHKFVRVNKKVMQHFWDNRKLITYLPQHSFLPNHKKIKTLIPYFIHQKNISEFCNLEVVKPLLSLKSNEISGGNKRVLEILLLIFSDSQFVLLDEPFHSLAPKNIELIKELISKESSKKGFIISDHQYKEVLKISTKTYLLFSGSLKLIKNIEDLKFYQYVKP